MAREEQQAFLRDHRLCIVGFPAARGPQMCPVYDVMDGADILISTTAARFKAKAVRRDPALSVCVLGEQSSFPYLLVYGRGRIEEDGAVHQMTKVGEKMTGNPSRNQRGPPSSSERSRGAASSCE